MSSWRTDCLEFFVAGATRRLFTNVEIDLLKRVVADNRIPECQGFDLFLRFNEPGWVIPMAFVAHTELVLS